MTDVHSPDSPKGEMVCSICLEPCQYPAIQPCGHNFCQACSSRSWGEELKEKVTCSGCRGVFLKNKPGSKEPLGEMEEPTSVMTVDETKPSPESVCDIHKEALHLFCVEDQTPLCSVCRKSWDHASHTVVPRNQTENQGTGSPFNGWEDGFPEAKPTNSAIVGYSNMTTGFKGKGETLDGNKKDDMDKLVPIEQWVDFNVEENKEEGRQSNSRVQNSITWIVLVLFIIQIVGLVTTIFVFTSAKPDLPAAAAAASATHCCPPGWIMNQGSCYHVLDQEGAWHAGQQHCASLGASLAVIENLEKLKVAVHGKGPLNHWVGLLRESEESWRWPDGTVFNNLFEVEGDERCAYLSNGAVSSADCSVEKKWLCSRKVKRRDGSHSHCRAT